VGAVGPPTQYKPRISWNEGPEGTSSGNHKRINRWRKKQASGTLEKRPGASSNK